MGVHTRNYLPEENDEQNENKETPRFPGIFSAGIGGGHSGSVLVDEWSDSSDGAGR